MPLYEFECQNCGELFEELVRSSNWEGLLCPACQSEQIRKKVSSFASRAAGSSLSIGSASSNASCAPGGL
ncbi:MAG: FmdB family zinc ribbon protein [Anaerolineales bacterium]|jgi:putative FmdB family regulatory protein